MEKYDNIYIYIYNAVCNGECSECQNEKANCSICYEEDYKYTTGSTSTCLNQCDSHRQYAVVTVTPPVRKCEGIIYFYLRLFY